MSLVLGLGLEHSCPWPREVLSSERLSLALALASDFFCVLGLGLEPCVLDSTSDSGNGEGCIAFSETTAYSASTTIGWGSILKTTKKWSLIMISWIRRVLSKFIY